GLIDVGFESEFISAKHLLSFLTFDVGANRFFGHMSHGYGVVATTPTRGNPGAKGREFFSQHATREAFKSINNLSYTPTRVKFNEQVNVIGHDFQRMNRHLQLV